MVDCDVARHMNGELLDRVDCNLTPFDVLLVIQSVM